MPCFFDSDSPSLHSSLKMTEDQKDPDFNLVDGHGYMLDRNYAAASRLNFQFYLWKESLQFNIHPSIPVPVDNARIADVATGTAIWLIDSARNLPTAQLDGFDINLGQAPLQQWLPSNVTLRHWNIFDDIPQDMLEKYDIVHVRLLILVVENSDPRPIIRKLIKMLKPGGYLQWDDLNYPDTCVKAIDPSLPTPALHEFRKLAYSRGRHDWTLQLADITRDEGLEEAKLYHFEDRIELAKANGEQHLLTMEEFASRLAEVGKVDEAAKLYQLIRDVYKESRAGAALSMPRVVSVARKARALDISPVGT
jgi:SAM-dependent methyltransferase